MRVTRERDTVRKWIAWKVAAMALGAAFLLGGCFSTPSSLTFSVHGAPAESALSFLIQESEFPIRCLWAHNPFRRIDVVEYTPKGRMAFTVWNVTQLGSGPVPKNVVYGLRPESYSSFEPPYPLETGIVYGLSPNLFFTLVPNGEGITIVRSDSVWDVIAKKSDQYSVYPDPPDENVFGAREQFSTETVHSTSIDHEEFNVTLTLRWRIRDVDAFAKRMITLERGVDRLTEYMRRALRPTGEYSYQEFHERREDMEQMILDNLQEYMPPERFGMEIVDVAMPVPAPYWE